MQQLDVQIDKETDPAEPVIDSYKRHLIKNKNASNAAFKMVGKSKAMQDVHRLVKKAAITSATVLLTGETGTGKELIARSIHELSHRSTGPYIRVNCGALSESLLESELFGHVKGAFTNALENRAGRFEAAHGGTIFLDEINSMSYKLQVKLLRVLQEQEFERVGETRTVKVDCRIIAATNRNLYKEVVEGRFRDDLFYRLNVIPIELPPLRSRGEDIKSLARHFVSRFASENEKPGLTIHESFLAVLEGYAWPGNVRELENYIERAVILADTDTLRSEDLPDYVRGITPAPIFRENNASIEGLCRELVSQGLSKGIASRSSTTYQDIISYVEREMILQALQLCNWTQTRAAACLGINRNTLHKRMEELNLNGDISSG